MLVTVAHGTRNVAGNDVARQITAAAAERAGVRGLASFVELAEPLFADVMRAAEEPVTVVPLLLSTGYHVRVDLPEAAESAGVPVRMGGPLGPDPLLAAAQVARLAEAGVESGRRVVLVAAGSTDRDATCDQLAAVAHLARAWHGPVELATIAGHGPRPADVVRPGDAVSPYLLSPGFFYDRLVAEVPDDVVVADVIGVQDAVVDLVVARAR